MENEPRWIEPGEVCEINRIEVEANGQEYVALNVDYVSGACARPQNRWHYDGERDLISLATTLLFSVAQSHAFKDGNKRTGFYAAITFLQANGFSIPKLDTETLAVGVIAVIAGEMAQDTFEAYFRVGIEKLD